MNNPSPLESTGFSRGSHLCCTSSIHVFVLLAAPLGQGLAASCRESLAFFPTERRNTDVAARRRAVDLSRSSRAADGVTARGGFVGVKRAHNALTRLAARMALPFVGSSFGLDVPANSRFGTSSRRFSQHYSERCLLDADRLEQKQGGQYLLCIRRRYRSTSTFFSAVQQPKSSFARSACGKQTNSQGDLTSQNYGYFLDFVLAAVSSKLVQ